jgi:preprotein translocase subunit YajC
MFDLIIAAGLFVVVLLAVGGFYLYQRRQRQRKAIDDILFDVTPLAVWTYQAEEWRQAVTDELSWGRVDDGPTDIRICRSGVYFKNQAREHLMPLADGTRIVTFAGYLGEGIPLKLRTRWRVITQDQNGNEEIHYHKEDFRIPVPVREKDAALNVVSYFTNWLDDHEQFYAMMVPDDEPISVFGKDSF